MTCQVQFRFHYNSLTFFTLVIIFYSYSYSYDNLIKLTTLHYSPSMNNDSESLENEIRPEKF